MDNEIEFVDKSGRYEAAHKSGAADCLDQFARLGFELPDAFGKIAVKIRACAQVATAGNGACPGSMPLYPFWVKTALGISFMGVAKTSVEVGQ